jgi:hypothetical protein
MIKHYLSGLAKLRADVEAAMGQVQGGGTAVQWAQESCQAVRQEGFYPAGRMISAEYAERYRGLLVKRLAQGAKRLAEALNSAAEADIR